MPLPLLTLLSAYLIGAIPFGYIVARLRGVDIFQMGSGNIGATNVGRVLGRKFGMFVFVLDFAKGAIPVVLARWAARQSSVGWLQELPAGTLETTAGLLAFLGHLFPIYLRFRGGKGVATGTGVVAMLVPTATLAAALTWILVVLAFRYVSLASVCAAFALVATQGFTVPVELLPRDPATWFCVLAGGMVVARHRSNIVRLVNGQENRLKESAFMSRVTRVVHVLCVGLWFGSSVFFNFFAAPALFAQFQAATSRPEKDRPLWLGSEKIFARQDDSIDGAKERGTWAAGFAVGPLFPILFLIGATCGFGAIATAIPWMRMRPGERVHHWRLTILLVGLTCVLAGWPLQRHVRELQGDRHSKTVAYLTAATPEESMVAGAEMAEARQTFGRWHLASLLLSIITVGLVGAAMALAAFLPPDAPDRPAPATSSPPQEASINVHEMPTESLDP